MRGLLIAGLLAASLAADARAQDWRFIDTLLAQSMDIREGDPPPIFFVDHADPSLARLGLAIHYPPNRSGGNSYGITVALFQQANGGWGFVGPVEGLFGVNPRDAAFLGPQIELTTSTLGPNDARCCPTEEARWMIDVAQRTAFRVP